MREDKTWYDKIDRRNEKKIKINVYKEKKSSKIFWEKDWKKS